MHPLHAEAIASERGRVQNREVCVSKATAELTTASRSHLSRSLTSQRSPASWSKAAHDRADADSLGWTAVIRVRAAHVAACGLPGQPRVQETNGLQSASGSMVALTAADKESRLALMKEKVAQVGMAIPATMQPDGDIDGVFVRYLRARKYNVDQALKQLSDTLAWRKEHDVDSYLFRKLSPEKEASLRRHQHIGHIGVDKQGRPIYLEMSAQTNIAGMIADGVSTEDFEFASLRQMEYLVRIRLAACQKAAGRKLDGHIVISDFEGASFSLLAPTNLKILKTVAKLYADHYPEFMVSCFVVHPPMIMSAIWKCLQVFIDDGTKTKVKFVSGQGTQLLAEVDASVLPPSMGGTRPAEDRLVTGSDGFVPASWKEMDDAIAAEHRRLGNGKLDTAAENQVNIVAQA